LLKAALSAKRSGALAGWPRVPDRRAGYPCAVGSKDLLHQTLSAALVCKMKTEEMKIFVMTFSALVFAGCTTPYQRTGFTGGFSETRLQENAFIVSLKISE